MTDCPCPHPDIHLHPSHDLLRFRNDKITLERILAAGADPTLRLGEAARVVRSMP